MELSKQEFEKEIGLIHRAIELLEGRLSKLETRSGLYGESLIDTIRREESQTVTVIAQPIPNLTDVQIQSVAPLRLAPAPEPEIELVINDEWKDALGKIENKSIPALFITGGAGTGKSTLTNYSMEHTDASYAIVAPTGAAAMRVGGQTIHSFFHFDPKRPEPKDVEFVSQEKQRRRYTKLECLYIDEISMVAAPLMDQMNEFLKLNRNDPRPFGGVLLRTIGDLFQLPPVVTDTHLKKMYLDMYGTDLPFFFHAQIWQEIPLQQIQLQTVFRQKAPEFVEALNAIRTGTFEKRHLDLLNSRVDRDFRPPKDETWIVLNTTNAGVDMANSRVLNALPGREKVFEARIVGEFKPKDSPADQNLALKVGCPVMFIKNDGIEKRWVNGSLGRIVEIEANVDNPDEPIIGVELNSGKIVHVEKAKWESVKYEYDEKTKKLKKNVTGTFEQFPIRVAAAITTHKSQGMSFDKCIIDFSQAGAFAEGQTYVALSRCRTLEGLILRVPLTEKDIMVNKEVQAFMSGQPILKPVPAQPGLFDEPNSVSDLANEMESLKGE